MIASILRAIFKSHPNPDDPVTRSYCGKFSGAVGMGLNLLLFLGKLLAGLISGSVSVMADAVNNLSDASSSVVTLAGFKLAEKPADNDHPYGHARIEYIAGLIVAAMILVIGVELVKSSIEKILHPAPVVFSALTIGILIASILVKLWMAAFNKRLGKAIHSPTLEATAADSRNDVITTAAVLLAGVVGRLTNLHIDGYAGLAVAIFILWSGIGIAKDTIDPLLGAAPDPELVHRIRDRVLSYDKVLGIHDLIVHDYGPGRQFASVHVEMDSHEDPLVCHNIIDDIERDIARELHVQLVVHYDPLVTDDPELNHMRDLITDQLHSIDPRLNLHDFRMVRGPKHANLIFDLVLPFDLKNRQSEIQAAVEQAIACEKHKYYAVITFDDSSFNQ